MYLLHRKKIDIYANISLFLSYSEVTVATRSGPYPAQIVTAITRHSPYPDQVVDQHDLYLCRDDLYSPERQQTPGHLDEPQRQIPSEDLDSHREKTTGTS